MVETFVFDHRCDEINKSIKDVNKQWLINWLAVGIMNFKIAGQLSKNEVSGYQNYNW